MWDDPMLVGWGWPYVAVRGVEAEPTVLVMAGVHGLRYSSIDAARRLAAEHRQPGLLASTRERSSFAPAVTELADPPSCRRHPA